ncbi:hypothetical protein Ae168Ps1_4127c [Pseudonocardia sp. Ae168_Ps1]|nr:hypothetical protein Ae150APs1_4099c [Pseudonocardia sp. Ae150A_Ps1]OLL81721.1 hypothetical protein Ae168Ps1_4127c [Pseudonocardia sp. Ae168_Ps1]OLL95815.1 hypothetical protein Ae356Ps1_5712c [Pseudonocardia sp. Ae356_Ps1]
MAARPRVGRPAAGLTRRGRTVHGGRASGPDARPRRRGQGAG